MMMGVTVLMDLVKMAREAGDASVTWDVQGTAVLLHSSSQCKSPLLTAVVVHAPICWSSWISALPSDESAL